MKKAAIQLVESLGTAASGSAAAFMETVPDTDSRFQRVFGTPDFAVGYWLEQAKMAQMTSEFGAAAQQAGATAPTKTSGGRPPSVKPGASRISTSWSELLLGSLRRKDVIFTEIFPDISIPGALSNMYSLRQVSHATPQWVNSNLPADALDEVLRHVMQSGLRAVKALNGITRTAAGLVLIHFAVLTAITELSVSTLTLTEESASGRLTADNEKHERLVVMRHEMTESSACSGHVVLMVKTGDRYLGCMDLTLRLINERAEVRHAVNQAAKEAVAMAIINARNDCYDPVSVVLGDGYRLIRLCFTPKRIKMEKENFWPPFAPTKVAGEFSHSIAEALWTDDFSGFAACNGVKSPQTRKAMQLLLDAFWPQEMRGGAAQIRESVAAAAQAIQTELDGFV